MYQNKGFSIVLIVLISITDILLAQQLRVQPEYDSVVKDLDKYLKNDRFFNLQVKCVIYDGNCIACTEKQSQNLAKVITYIQEEKPQVYRDAIIKYVQKSGIQVPQSQ